VDILDHPRKEKNLASLKFKTFMDRDDFPDRIRSGSLGEVSALFHMGACSSTTETDIEFLTRNNLQYSQHLARYCLERNIRMIYASSAATYGDGRRGYSDDESQLEILQPLNPYGQSKQDFDLWAKREGVLDRLVGLKYFNVYGPNEYHKEDMRSMVLKGYEQIRDTGTIRLFKSYHPDYEDGGQVRDFIYVQDAVAMTMFFYDRPKTAGLFNVGTGRVRSWNDLARAIFEAMGRTPAIEYIEMPDNIRDQYQYHTCAEMDKIRRAGYDLPHTPLEEAVRDYVTQYLIPGRHLQS
ncbi:MAG: ADP-glyceromanno-heptose 6-epimerase, partial [Nitrospinaceae bacterium]|nr:ADP-glyceromanno-heptose 6-epimerase [Nitrospinaceae bacterium]NIR55864.1 ADP-glyceromanno-heptose 6-epimerase [Nitrospinaceae bacterium]NIS86317.1 ADP-glyceromanno-heptose 6-epimerase [Nitrospinaceae bacterium]NIT83147.1 ADP-glyceromanno-heptose 6-epimerase [Nitrospinaceae bacterium]NIU45356.1 ADP-glyceromanno-heptose 6-epimerase [Nitrospinaceae bacterium]